MTYANHPPTLYDEIIEERDYPKHNGTVIPVRNSAIDEIAAHEGETEIQLDRPDGTTHTLTGDEPILSRDELLDTFASAQKAFNDHPLTTLTNQYGGRLGPLHYTDSTAHFTVGESIFEARPQRGSPSIPAQFRTLGVKAAHLNEGFKIASSLPHHWREDVGWEITSREQFNHAMQDEDIPEDRAPPAEEAFIINVGIQFPARSFGQTTGAPAEVVNHTISRTEKTLSETLLTKRMAQLDAIDQGHGVLDSQADQRVIDGDELPDVDTVAQETFGISQSGLASLRSQMRDRRDKAFETVRRLSDSDDFNYVMEEFAETIDELGELAMLGTRYRDEVMDKPPGFY